MSLRLREDLNATGLWRMLHDLDENPRFPPNKVLEIGSYQGDSAAMFAEIFDIVICIDPWVNDTVEFIGNGKADVIEKDFNNMMTMAGNVIKLKAYSHEVHGILDTPVDLLYIDGEHSYQGTRRDYELFANLVPAHGYIGFHDYGRRDGVTKFTNELILKHNIKDWKVYQDTTLLISKRSLL